MTHSVMGSEDVLDFHLKCSEIQNEILSQRDPQLKRDYIKKYIEALNDTDGILVPEFENDDEWFNVDQPLSFRGSLRDKILVLDFFTYCCINCMHVLPDLEALESLHKDTDGLVIVGVHSAKFDNEKLSANIISAVLRYNILHPVVNDAKARLWHALGIRCWPTLVIVNPYGRAIFVLAGEGNRDTLKTFVTEAIHYYEKKSKVSHDPVPLKLMKDSIQGTVLQFPGKICCSANGKKLAIADTGYHRIIITDHNGIVQVCFGGKDPGFSDGCCSVARFKSPQGVCFRNNNEIYVADTENHAIRKIDLEQYKVTTVAGTGCQGTDMEGGQMGTAQAISSPWDVAVDKDNPNLLFIAMAGTHQIWVLFLADSQWIKDSFYKKGTCMRFAGSGREENRNNNYPQSAGFAQPSGIAIGKTSSEMEYSTLFVADSESSTIRAVSLKDGSVKSVVGGDIDPLNLFAFGDVDGKATKAKLQHPLGVAVVPQQGVLFVADSYNHKVKMVNPVTRSCVTIIGSGQPGHNSGLDGDILNEPGGLAVHPSGDNIYIADTNNHCIKQLNMYIMEFSELPVIFPGENKVDVTDNTKSDNQMVCPQKLVLDPVTVRPGERLNVQLDISLVDGCYFNKEAPNKWALYTEDAALRQAISMKNSGEIESLASSKLCTIHVPQYNKSCAVELVTECSIFLCDGSDSCVVKSLVFVQPLDVLITEEKSAREEVVKLVCSLSAKSN